MLSHQTINVDSKCSSLDWIGSRLIDWTSNRVYFDPLQEGSFKNKYSFGDRFDGVRSINDGEYVIIFERLGTKGLILKNGSLLREINRSYYHSYTFEYPIEIFKISSGSVLIAHCPEDYNRIEIEEIESGDVLTQSKLRKPKDIFHSRLKVSPNGKFLISAGWVWHPMDVLTVFDIKKVLVDPTSLDLHELGPQVSSEVSSANFMKDSRILISTTSEEPVFEEDENVLPPNHVGIYNIESDRLDRMFQQPVALGNLIPIDGETSWDLYKYPKVLNLKNGKVLASLEELDSGEQNSSIMFHRERLPLHSVSQDGTKLAISNGTKVEILEWKRSE